MLKIHEKFEQLEAVQKYLPLIKYDEVTDSYMPIYKEDLPDYVVGLIDGMYIMFSAFLESNNE